MRINDIRPLKNELRAKSRADRAALQPAERARLCAMISENLFALAQYKTAKRLLCYVSTDIEVDTSFIIERAWRDGKAVAVPKCIAGTRNMDFYLIHSRLDLERGAFGVWEPVAARCEKLTDFNTGLCLVPALMYDAQGYRLGYGKGYYDRFLSGFSGITAGIAYEFALTELLPHGKYDKSTELIITEKRVISTQERRVCKNGQ